MTVTPASFRADFVEFANVSDYPDAAINWWLAWGGMFMNQDRWGLPGSVSSPPTTPYDMGMELQVAHFLVLNKKQVDAAVAGGLPGLAEGVVAGKSVGPASISFDTASAAEINAGHWNLTTYGTRFYRLAQMIGMGPVQVGGCGAMGYGGGAGAWSGPPVGWPGWYWG